MLYVADIIIVLFEVTGSIRLVPFGRNTIKQNSSQYYYPVPFILVPQMALKSVNKNEL